MSHSVSTERTHITFKTQCKGESMKQLQVQKRFLEAVGAEMGTGVMGWETGFRTESAMWWDPQVPPRSSYGLQVIPLSLLLTKMHKGWGNRDSARRKEGQVTKPSQCEPWGNDTTSLSRANSSCVSNLLNLSHCVPVIHYHNVPDPFHKENRHLKVELFFKTNIYFANNICNIFHF